ncbi:MAG: TonB-dependent receptor [Acidobacteria bacterium RIFCSPLOWO2_12_FULL_65_11]|nr:MAG: TonB-dependent receptor [Acidobacteria bacterium RIFCSPLOWO2_02_FULL_64_15]OFW32479.1 MAG: TonB-dependent receptor [Acidobacteria bacterium RIFCSPLOWO2_12_FULL_65_11]
MKHLTPFFFALAVLVVGANDWLAAGQHAGQVTFGGLPVPGATVTASQGDRQVATTTDQQGIYRFADLADGVWSVRVEMLGFSTLSESIAVAADAPPSMWELKLLPFEEIARGAVRLKPDTTTPGAQSPDSDVRSVRLQPDPVQPDRGAASGGFQQASVSPTNAVNSANPENSANVRNPGSPATNAAANGDASDLIQQAAEGFLVNGSVNNGAASPFAQLAAFGNSRRGVRSLYNGALGILFGTSAWDARPFSFAGQRTPKPSYDDVQVLGTFGGPIKMSNLPNRANLFIGYQRMSDHSATTQSARMPTLLERTGDFSQSTNAFGQPVTIINPATGVPFGGNVIPPGQISPQAAALLGYFPQPNLDGAGRFNYQSPVVVATRQDSVQSRLAQGVSGRTQVFGNLGYQRTTTDTTSLFGFSDSNRVSNLDTAINWSRRFSPFLSLRLRYQFTRQTTEMTPSFANRTNVSGSAAIAGNNQDPVNWGPPTLTFSSGLAGLTDAQYVFNRSLTHAVLAESGMSRGRHYVLFGGGVRRNYFDVLSQQDPRGTFGFTGAASGSDLADFLLGIPHTSSIAFGNADKYLRANVYEAYLNDDWRLSPGFTLNLGLRWEYEAPMSEAFGRLVNLDVAPGFGAVSPVVASSPIGTLTGRRYADSLVNPDTRGVQPRVGLAWRPVAGSSLVVRAGYGIYRNTNVYQSIAMLMAQQPPLSNTLSVENSAGNPLTLANGFIATPGATPNTFAVDPDFRVGYAQNWQVSMQRDLPASLTMIATYLGAKGSHLMQEFLPNTYPAGAANPCPTCPSGFVYLTSNGSSSRQAGQFELRRRLRDGFTATVQYTLSKSTDDTGAFAGVSLTGAAIAQDWLNLDAERGPSNFDQRHLVTAQVQYTTGIGVAGGGLLTGVTGALVKGWTLTSQLTAGSGLPLNPAYLSSVAGTGVTGTLRPDVTSASADLPSGYYANPAAYAAPAAGSWGNAGRNSIRGPAQFSLNMGLGRSFPWGDRLSLDWRVDATNVLNRVTYSGVNTIVGSPQFGLPNRANAMRKIQTSLRLRF